MIIICGIIWEYSWFKYIDFCCSHILEIINSNNKKKIKIALSGGSTPHPILKKLSKKKINWENIEFYQVDERGPKEGVEMNNYRKLNKNFLSKINSKSYSFLNTKFSLEQNLIDYKNIISQNVKMKNGFPVFDLLLLGMGNDGHIASLFKESDGIYIKDEIIIINYVKKIDSYRYTMTFPTIFNAKKIVLLFTGDEKYNVLRESSDLPIHHLIKNYDNIDILWAK